MENKIENQTSEASIQDYFSLGYLYLLLLGILREVVYYGFLDVNILSYSNVLDVLLSPLVYISKNPIVFGSLVVIAIVVHYVNKYAYSKKQKKIAESTEENTATLPDFKMGTLVLFSLAVLGFFLGTGLGSGIKHSKILKNGEFETTHQLTFTDKEKLEAKVLGNNSQYIFYVLENEKNVSISPIQGNIKTIEKLPLEE